MRKSWGNLGWAGRTAYLEEVEKWAAITPGPVFECGSGLTTLLLGLFAARRGIPVWTLEHDLYWHELMSAALSRHDVSGIELCYAFLRNYKKCSWYSVPFERMLSYFALVICDGPPMRTTRGSRYGLVPVMHDHLSRESVILLDDVNLDGEADALTKWSAEGEVASKIFKADESQAFGLIIM